jgi:glycosyltransferase involved in cell wall biosynthesis
MVSKLDTKLKNINVAIVTHIFSSGPALDLEIFLQKKTRGLLLIGHPFSFTKDQSSFFRSYENGKLLKEYKALPLRLPSPFIYVKELILTFLWILKDNKKIDLYIGSDGFSGYMGLLLKKLGKVKEVILYTIDFVPNRFENPVLNYLYHFFDKQCLKKCKIIWNVSPAMETARSEIKSLNKNNFSPQITVPLGVWYDRIPKLKLSERNNFSLIYMGHLLEKQGVDMVIKSMKYLKKEIPMIRLTIIGTGSHENFLKKLVKKHNLEKHVNFTGYIKNHRDVEKMLTKGTVGMAMYKPVPENYTYFADPGKLKNYLAAGLPVILTDVPLIAKDLAQSRCAIISEYEEKKLAENILDLLKNKHKLKIYRKNAINYAKNYDWNDIFTKALSLSLE